MSIFGDYARWYDLLYRDKDYEGEVEYVHNLIQQHMPGATSILELGCGTGAHAIRLAEKGYRICGADISQEMLKCAAARRDLLAPEVAARLSFVHCDIRHLNVETRFDVMLSLFHVIGYQVENQDLDDTFASIARHLRSDGILIFDCWYGPGVLSDHPKTRVRRAQDSTTSITRIAEPVMLTDTNSVEVHYDLFVEDQATGTIRLVEESHRMRYLFTPEVERLMDAAELEMLGVYEWMTFREPTHDTWNVCYMAKKKGLG